MNGKQKIELLFFMLIASTISFYIGYHTYASIAETEERIQISAIIDGSLHSALGGVCTMDLNNCVVDCLRMNAECETKEIMFCQEWNANRTRYLRNG